MTSEDYIPQYLDEPERFILFTPDEFGFFLGPLVVVTSFSNFLYGLVAGFAGFVALRKLKEGGPLHRLMWRAYWILPSGLIKLKGTPPSHLRHMAG